MAPLFTATAVGNKEKYSELLRGVLNTVHVTSEQVAIGTLSRTESPSHWVVSN